MASFRESRYQLTSNQTALVFVLPRNQRTDINSLRSLHDKAFQKWDPHISVLYPFVDPSVLDSAIATLRQTLNAEQFENLRITTDQVGVFRHRRNATVFLKPDLESEDGISQLRKVFVKALGCRDKDGTHDGIFRPHLTVGQASLNGSAVDKLAEQVEKLVGLGWEGSSLSVLKRQASGEMMLIDELHFSHAEDATGFHIETSFIDDWIHCFSKFPDGRWNRALNPEALTSNTTLPTEISISTYNLMAGNESFVPPFQSRLDLIMQAVSSVTSPSEPALKILCLQEINDEMLPLILSNPHIQSAFPFSTHSPSSVLPSRRNLVTLASRPFTQYSLQFSERHKSALIISLCDFPLDIANIHLTSSLTNGAVEAKKNQMQKLTNFLLHERKHDLKDIIVAGDFNLTTSKSTLEMALSKKFITVETAKLAGKVVDSKFWIDTFDFPESHSMGHDQIDYEGEEGATFDRLANPLAALTDSPIVNRPERYDRILFSKESRFRVKHFEVFGHPNEQGQCGSDHYGVQTILRPLASQESAPILPPVASVPSLALSDDIDVVEDLTDMQNLIEPYLPTVADRQLRQQALEILQETLTSNQSKITNLVFASLGSYCMDTFFTDSDVDILVIGTVAPQAFFDFAGSKLRALHSAGESIFKGVHFVNSLVSILELAIMGVKFDLQYCQAAELVQRYHTTKPPQDLTKMVFDSSLISSLHPSSIRPLNTYRDTAFLLNSIPDLPCYRTAHRFLSLYLKHRGLYSAKFGYLGGIHLSLMLNRVVKLIAANIQKPSVLNLHGGGDANFTPATIIRTFFSYYAAFDWAQDNITDPSLPDHQKVSRSPRDSIFIYSIHTPTARPNVASSCTKLTAKTLTQEFLIAAEKIRFGNWQWCIRPREASIVDFLNGFGAFICVQVDVWDTYEVGGDRVRAMLGGLESKFPRLLVALGRISGLEGRVWPGRLCERKENSGKENHENVQEQQFKGNYIVGVSGREEEMDVQKKKLFTGKVITAVREFERSTKESREIEGGNIWITMEVIPKRKIIEMDLVEDLRDWGRMEEPRTMDSPPSEVDESAVNEENLSNEPPSSLKSQQRSSSKSLRPAQDIMSRIHWDPALSVTDFMVGYEDRFLGVKEIELARWKSEQTDEEFIPMHRIVWVRKKGLGDGEKVWDRRRKIDLIFGSGVTGGKAERG